MRIFSFRLLIPLASVLCFVVWHGVASDLALAQRRVPTSATSESPSQRLLPFPQGPLANPRQQVQWLQQLKDWLGAEGRLPTLPTLNPEQLKLLQEQLQQGAGERSNVPPLPKLDGLSPEQLSHALSDPALREQVRKLLEQFQTQGQPTRNGTALDPKGTASPEAVPRELQELMKRLTEQAVRPQSTPAQNDLSSKRNSAGTASTERENAEADRPPGKQMPSREPIGHDESSVSKSELRTTASSENPNRSSPSLGSDRRPAVVPPAVDAAVARPAQPSETPALPDLSRQTSPPLNFQPSINAPSSSELPSSSRRDSGNRATVPPNGSLAGQSGASRNESTAPSPISSFMVPSDSPADTRRAPIDVRSELEERGFAETFQKLVEQARENTLADSRNSAATPGSHSAASGGSTAGLAGSAGRLKNGLSQDLAETARDTRRSSTSPTTSSRSKHPEQTRMAAPDPNRPSLLNSVAKSANTVLSNISTAPEARPAPTQTARPATPGSVGSFSPQGAGSRSTFGLLLLLAVLGLVWYFTPQFMAAMGNARRSKPLINEVLCPADIHSRTDVVQAFHQFALKSTTLAAAWWTHRAVEQQVALETPALQPAIQTLTNLYEQARYLPEETEFTPDQIGTARQAWEQCSANSRHVN